MKLIPAFIFLLLIPAGSLHAQKNLTDSIDIVVKKVMKNKRVKRTDMIDDSTGRTYEFSKKSGELVITCLKTIRDRVTTELHFIYANGQLLKINYSRFDNNVRQASFEDYYFSNDHILLPHSVGLEKSYIAYLLQTSKELAARAAEVYGSKK